MSPGKTKQNISKIRRMNNLNPVRADQHRNKHYREMLTFKDNNKNIAKRKKKLRSLRSQDRKY